MRKLDCDRMRDDLKAYGDHELTPFRRWSVSRHLASCAACRAEVKEMTQITEELTRDEAETLDPSLRGSMVETLKGAGASERPPVDHRRKITIPKIVLAGSAAAVLAAVFFPVFAGGRMMSPFDRTHSLSARSVYSFEPTFGPRDQSSSRRDAPSPGIASGAPAVSNAAPQTGDAADDASLGRQVHKTATITVQVADPEASGERIEDAVKSAGGFVTNSSLNTDPSGVKTAALTVKVPLPVFEGTLTQIGKLGSVTAKNVTGEDITEQVSDADQRQAVLQQDMDQAQEQINKKGAKAGWELQEDARDLRIQLAQARARLHLLKNLAELSEIDVTLSQPPKSAPPVQTGFLSDLGASGRSALESALGCLSALIGLVFSILAYAPLWIPVWLLGRWLWRRYQKRIAMTP